MTIAVDCDCGKSLKVSDALAGKKVKCSACGTTLTVPAALPPPPDEAGDDFELLGDDTPLPEKPARKPVKAVAAEEEPAPEPARKPRKKKKKKAKRGEESDEDLYDRLDRSEARMRRIVRGTTFVVLGLAIIIGCIIVFTVYREDIKFVGAKAVGGIILFGVMGLAAVVKGIIGLFFGQFFGEDD